jgi:integrase
MTSRAKVYKHPRSPFFSAWFMVWDAQRQAWKPVSKSTRCRDKAKALEVAREFERIALASGGPDASTSLSRDYVGRVLNDIMRISGHRDVDDTKRWLDYSTAWLENEKKRVPSSLSFRSWQAYDARVKHFTTWLGKDANLPLGAIDGDRLQRWYAEGRASGLSISSMNSAAGAVSAIFERARNEGFTTRNPVALLKRDAAGGNTRDPFTAEDMEKLLRYLRAEPARQEWLTVALLGLCTSQRLGDCVKAMRSQFVEQSPFWVWELRQGKTKKKMRIPIVDPLASHLEELWKKGPTSLYLAPQLAQERDLSTKFTEILVAAGVVGRKVERKGKGRSFASKTFHSTRHTCNSLLANAGVPADVRRMITGHSDTETNLIYTHFDDKTKAKALVKAFAPQKKRKG